MDLNQPMDFIKHLDLSGTWLDVALISDTKKTRISQRLDYLLKYTNHSRLKSQLTLEGLV